MLDALPGNWEHNFKFPVLSPESRVCNLKSRVCNLKSRVQRTNLADAFVPQPEPTFDFLTAYL